MLGKRLARFIVPLTLRKLVRNFTILSERYGQRKSITRAKCIDSTENEIPWYTYPAIEYLDGLDFSNSNILEYGSGASSVWWAKRANSVTAIEHDKNWFKKVSAHGLENLSIELAPGKNDYLDVGKDDVFDIIIIDGVHRESCAKCIGSKLRKGGLVILDNSDWHPGTAEVLRVEYDLIEVDFHGFGPINDYTWTTSLFFSRDFCVKPIKGRLPLYSVGALRQIANTEVVQ